MSRILATQCDDSKMAMVMDDLSCPHCVWVDSLDVKYARFYGDEWRLAGGTAVAMTVPVSASVSKNCVGIDGNGNCFFAVMDGSDLKLCSWSGMSWTTETVWGGAGSNDVLAFGVAWADTFPVVAAFTRSLGNSSVWAIDKKTGSWGEPADVVVPPQDNEIVELKVAIVAGMAYLFWNGRDDTSGESWIGHTIWNPTTHQWLSRPSKRVEMSAKQGHIAGIDFATSYEG